MSLEGLGVVLEKEPVVGTPAARRLEESPEDVEAMYLRHVRSYVPLGRAAEGADDQMSVSDYEQRLIRMVKDGKAPKGYVTADFGYGKTSTCAFIWDRCRAANLLAVPPFQIEELDHLLRATYGWVRYNLARTRPLLVERASEIYDKYKVASFERIAKNRPDALAVLQDEYRAGRYRLELNATDYIHFFEEMTALVLEAGYEGLVVLVDELQQYIDPAIKAGVRDPISPLFDLVQALVTRKGYLKFGLIFSIPSKELGVINDQRGDLVQRLKMDQLAMDLRTVYDQAFARRLWETLATEADFTTEAGRIIAPETLVALGEIAARDDLANGPRTVVNVFKVMIARYLAGNGKTDPYSPLNLIDDFLNGQISFDGESKIQRAVGTALASRLVSGHPDRERAIRLFAAFPTEGATRPILERYGLATVADDLANVGQGELVIFVGGGRDSAGREEPIGITLRGLEPVISNVDWLQTTIREFTRTYFETNELIVRRAVDAFIVLLRERIFTAPQWKVAEELWAGLTQNRGIVFEGSFASTRRKYPERVVHIRILADSDTPRTEATHGDMVLEFILQRHLDVSEGERRRLGGTLDLESGERDTAYFSLNLMHRSSTEIYRDLHTTLQPVVNPWKLTPLLMLSLYQYIEEKRAKGLIPKGDDPFVRDNFQPTLLDHCLDELFNEDLGAPVAANEARIVEETFRRLCDRLLPRYHTLMVTDQWRNALKDYRTALERLPSRYEKQGAERFSGLKEDLANKFNRSNTALDSFITTFGELIEAIERWQGGKPGVVRFKLHPLEEEIRQQLEKSPEKATRGSEGNRHTVRVLATAQVYAEAQRQGYRTEEIDEVLTLMEKRELIARDALRGLLVETPHTTPSTEQYRTMLTDQQRRVHALLQLFPDDPQLLHWKDQHSRMLAELNAATTRLPDQTLSMRFRNLSAYDTGIDNLRESKRKELGQRTNDILRTFVPFDGTRYALLDRQTAGMLFADQLNHVRVDLLRDRTRLQGEDAAVRDHLTTLAERLSSSTIGDADLEPMIKELQRIGDQIQGRHRQIQQYTTIYNHYSEAARLLETATALQSTIYELGEPAESYARALDAWGLDVRSQISSEKREALARVVTWRDRLGDIQREVELIRSQAIERFITAQTRYREMLTRTFTIPQDQLFPLLTYNPLDPQGAYEGLYTAVRDMILRLSQAVNNRTEELQAQIRQVQSSNLDSLLDTERAELLAQYSAIAQKLQAIRPPIQQLLDVSLESVRQYTQRDDAESLAPLGAAFQAIRATLDAARQEKQALDRKLGQIALTPDEERLHTLIRQVVGTGEPEADLAQLLLGLGNGPISRQTIWPLLQALYDKRRLRIKVSVVGND
jgi:hypothetical protein